jgi:hypothetical protein
MKRQTKKHDELIEMIEDVQYNKVGIWRMAHLLLKSSDREVANWTHAALEEAKEVATKEPPS